MRCRQGRNRVGTAVATLAMNLVVLSLMACGRSSEIRGRRVDGVVPPPKSETEWLLRDVAVEVGVPFVHETGATGDFHFPEIMGAGAALADFDGDGDLDVYLVQSGAWDASSRRGDRLFRNDGAFGTDDAVGTDGAGQRSFTDITTASGLVANGYGMGVAVGDVDNDGHEDLYLANYGANQLWRNLGDGTFVDVTAAAGVDDPRWSAGAAFLDYDADGWLDLYVVNYVDARLVGSPRCRAPSSHPDYCGPHNFDGQADRLLRNRGDGTFEDVSAAAGILTEAGRGLGVATLDADGDGHLDLYVANDLERNLLWRNRGDGTFENVALLMGCAVNAMGLAEASMGLIAADLDADGDEDLFMTHLRGETNTFYRNDGSGFFVDASVSVQAGAASVGWTGFGAAAADFDGDGRLDLVVANGAVTRIEDQAATGDPYPYGEPNQLLLGTDDGTFTLVANDRLAPAFTASEVGRGLALGDVDNDGAPDVLITNNRGPARLFLNRASVARNWVGLVVHERSGRAALGARVVVHHAGGATVTRRVDSGGSYASARDSRVLISLDSPAETVRVSVTWSDGVVDSWDAVPTGQYTPLVRGTGA